MSSVIENYLLSKGTSSPVAARLENELKAHPDLYEECQQSIKCCVFPKRGECMIVEGYSAADIADMAPFFNHVGVYSFLAYLADEPDEAKRQIAEGFIRK